MLLKVCWFVSFMKISKVMDILEARYVPRAQPTVRSTSTETADPFKILIACLLSLRTTDINTERASSRLFAELSTPQETASAHIEKLEELIYSSGHYKRKAMILKSVSQELLDRFDGAVPDTKEELLSIKYIGPKTANIVLAFAYGQEVIPVDVHVHISSNRLGFVKTKTPEQTEKALEIVLPRRYWKEFNTVMVLFGQEICQTFSPKCSICLVGEHCPRMGVTRSR